MTIVAEVGADDVGVGVGVALGVDVDVPLGVGVGDGVTVGEVVGVAVGFVHLCWVAKDTAIPPDTAIAAVKATIRTARDQAAVDTKGVSHGRTGHAADPSSSPWRCERTELSLSVITGTVRPRASPRCQREAGAPGASWAARARFLALAMPHRQIFGRDMVSCAPRGAVDVLRSDDEPPRRVTSRARAGPGARQRLIRRRNDRTTWARRTPRWRRNY